MSRMGMPQTTCLNLGSSPLSLSFSPLSRGEFPAVAIAMGLALFLSACGGGGGGSAPSSQASDLVSPDARSSQADGLVSPDAPTATQNQGGPQIRNRALLSSASVVTDTSTIPFPSGTPTTDEMVNMNTFGQWGLPAYQPGGSGTNNGPDVPVRRRVGYSKMSLTLGQVWYGTAAIADLWLTYPASAGDTELAVHIRTKRATPGNYGSISDDVQKEQDAGESNAISQATGITSFGIPEFNYRGVTHKFHVIDWLNNAAKYSIPVEDFFLTEAYLQAPGTAVQPAAQGNRNERDLDRQGHRLRQPPPDPSRIEATKSAATPKS